MESLFFHLFEKIPRHLSNPTFNTMFARTLYRTLSCHMNPVEVSGSHGDEYIAQITEAVSTYETSVSFYHTTRRNFQEHRNLQTNSVHTLI